MLVMEFHKAEAQNKAVTLSSWGAAANLFSFCRWTAALHVGFTNMLLVAAWILFSISNTLYLMPSVCFVEAKRDSEIWFQELSIQSESLHSKPIWSWISKHSQRWSGSDLQKHILCICMCHFCSSDVINLIWIQSGYSKTDFGCKLDLSEYAQRSNRINEWFSAKYSWWGFFFIPWLFIVSLFIKRLVSLALHISNNEWKLWEITH